MIQLVFDLWVGGMLIGGGLPMSGRKLDGALGDGIISPSDYSEWKEFVK